MKAPPLILPLLAGCLKRPPRIRAREAAFEVPRFSIPGLAEGTYPVGLCICFRDGKPHHGFARVPNGDNLPHRIDVSPMPVRRGMADGILFEPERSATGTYS